jgi:hypothetical protein
VFTRCSAGFAGKYRVGIVSKYVPAQIGENYIGTVSLTAQLFFSPEHADQHIGIYQPFNAEVCRFSIMLRRLAGMRSNI